MDRETSTTPLDVHARLPSDLAREKRPDVGRRGRRTSRAEEPAKPRRSRRAHPRAGPARAIERRPRALRASRPRRPGQARCDGRASSRRRPRGARRGARRNAAAPHRPSPESCSKSPAVAHANGGPAPSGGATDAGASTTVTGRPARCARIESEGPGSVGSVVERSTVRRGAAGCAAEATLASIDASATAKMKALQGRVASGTVQVHRFELLQKRQPVFRDSKVGEWTFGTTRRRESHAA